MNDVTIEYGRTKLHEMRAHRSNDDDDAALLAPTIEINGEQLDTTDRFWESFLRHHRIAKSIFRYWNTEEVFFRISQRSKGDAMVRYAIERRAYYPRGRLLAMIGRGKPLIPFESAVDLLSRRGGVELHYEDGCITSQHKPLSGERWYQVGGDNFAHRYQMQVPIDGYTRPCIHLSLYRQICSNGMVGFAPAFRSELAGDNVGHAITRALDGFDNGDGFSALKQRVEMSQKSWASVHEANRLYKCLTNLQKYGQISDPRVLTRFSETTGDVCKLYGLANANMISSKHQRTLPVDCRVYDLITLASELATHFCSPSGAPELQAFIGTLVSRMYDLEGTAETTEFADFMVGKPSSN